MRSRPDAGRRASSYGQTMTIPNARDSILGLASAHVPARALHVVADLGITDALGAAARTAEEPAAGVGASADELTRLLRLLETCGVFACDDAGSWRHTEASRYLRRDHPASLLSYTRMSGTPFNWEPVAHFDHAVRSGEPGICRLDPRPLPGAPAGSLAHVLIVPQKACCAFGVLTARSWPDPLSPASWLAGNRRQAGMGRLFGSCRADLGPYPGSCRGPTLVLVSRVVRKGYQK